MVMDRVGMSMWLPGDVLVFTSRPPIIVVHQMGHIGPCNQSLGAYCQRGTGNASRGRRAPWSWWSQSCTLHTMRPLGTRVHRSFSPERSTWGVESHPTKLGVHVSTGLNSSHSPPPHTMLVQSLGYHTPIAPHDPFGSQ